MTLSSSLSRDWTSGGGSLPPLIMVGGSMRSGTTLLYSILCKSVDANDFLHECQYLTQQMKIFDKWRRDFPEFISDYFESKEAFEEYSRTIFHSYIAYSENFSPGQTLVLKNPWITRFFPTILEWFPDAKFIISVRDPADTLASILMVRKKLVHSRPDHYLVRIGSSIDRITELFLSYYGETLSPAFRAHPNTMFVRYEDLVTNYEAQSAELEAFTGIRLPDIGEIDSSGGGKALTADSYATALHGKPISGASVGSASARFSTVERDWILENCAQFNALFGYHQELGPDVPRRGPGAFSKRFYKASRMVRDTGLQIRYLGHGIRTWRRPKLPF